MLRIVGNKRIQYASNQSVISMRAHDLTSTPQIRSNAYHIGARDDRSMNIKGSIPAARN